MGERKIPNDDLAVELKFFMTINFSGIGAVIGGIAGAVNYGEVIDCFNLAKICLKTYRLNNSEEKCAHKSLNHRFKTVETVGSAPKFRCGYGAEIVCEYNNLIPREFDVCPRLGNR
jgi:hypothetical protein